MNSLEGPLLFPISPGRGELPPLLDALPELARGGVRHFLLLEKTCAPAVRGALVALEAALMPFAPRPHWGKLFLMPASAFHHRYRRLGEFRALAQRHDPRGKFRNAFLDRNVFGQ